MSDEKLKMVRLKVLEYKVVLTYGFNYLQLSLDWRHNKVFTNFTANKISQIILGFFQPYNFICHSHQNQSYQKAQPICT